MACVHDVQLVFPSWCWPFPRWSDRTDSCSSVDGHGFAKGYSGYAFFFCLFLCLFVIRVEVFPLVLRVGFCVDLAFVDRVLAIVWLGVI